jgi:D-3-phosphoglycerate dehydrogenase / 2-oxoglutarate reductase
MYRAAVAFVVCVLFPLVVFLSPSVLLFSPLPPPPPHPTHPLHPPPGTGRIGKSMAQMSGAGFGMRVLGYDPNKDAAYMKAAGIQKVDKLIDMLRQSDFVSVHASLSSTSKNLIGKAEFAAMKPTAFFINSARGALVVEQELIRALVEKRIAGAGIDVFSNEPLNKTTHPFAPLYALENVILHPHLTFYTEEAMQRLTDDTLDRCYEALLGKPISIKSRDPRLVSQAAGIAIVPPSSE